MKNIKSLRKKFKYNLKKNKKRVEVVLKIYMKMTLY